MKADDLVKALRQYPNEVEAKRIAAEFLGPAAKEWWEVYGKIEQKRLFEPKTFKMAKEFTANGQKYYILGPDEGINVFRMTKLKQMLSIVYKDQNFSEQINYSRVLMEELRKLGTNKWRPDIVFQLVQQDLERLEATGEREWEYSLMSCTFFIVRPDEDLETWTEQDANKKIEDWAKEGIPAMDFFFCNLTWGNTFNEKRNQLQKLAEEVAKRKR